MCISMRVSRKFVVAACGSGSLGLIFAHKSYAEARPVSVKNSTPLDPALSVSWEEFARQRSAQRQDGLFFTHSNDTDMKSRMERMVRNTQEHYCHLLEEVDGKGKFVTDVHTREKSGAASLRCASLRLRRETAALCRSGVLCSSGGITKVMTDGEVFEKAGVSVSVSSGLLPWRAVQHMVADHAKVSRMIEEHKANGAEGLEFFAASVLPRPALHLPRICAGIDWPTSTPAIVSPASARHSPGRPRSYLCWDCCHSTSIRQPTRNTMPRGMMQVSSVVHPKNPHAPTGHFNYRYFELAYPFPPLRPPACTPTARLPTPPHTRTRTHTRTHKHINTEPNALARTHTRAPTHAQAGACRGTLKMGSLCPRHGGLVAVAT
jgi:hypothetical protein